MNCVSWFDSSRMKIEKQLNQKRYVTKAICNAAPPKRAVAFDDQFKWIGRPVFRISIRRNYVEVRPHKAN